MPAKVLACNDVSQIFFSVSEYTVSDMRTLFAEDDSR